MTNRVIAATLVAILGPLAIFASGFTPIPWIAATAGDETDSANAILSITHGWLLSCLAFGVSATSSVVAAVSRTGGIVMTSITTAAMALLLAFTTQLFFVYPERLARYSEVTGQLSWDEAYQNAVLQPMAYIGLAISLFALIASALLMLRAIRSSGAPSTHARGTAADLDERVSSSAPGSRD